jgi:hypothetical protein
VRVRTSPIKSNWGALENTGRPIGKHWEGNADAIAAKAIFITQGSIKGGETVQKQNA